MTTELCVTTQAPADVEARLDELLQKCREVPTLEFSRRLEGGLGIIAFNAALNTFCELGCGPVAQGLGVYGLDSFQGFRACALLDARRCSLTSTALLASRKKKHKNKESYPL